MKVLVTGREGQLARSIMERARNMEDLAVVSVGRPALDLTDAQSVRREIQGAAPDLVINAAAYTAVDQAEDEPELAFRTNGGGAGEVAAAAREAGAGIIQISTDYVFDGQTCGTYDERDSTNPLGVYGASKLEGEARVREANDDHVIIRMAWIYSPFGRNFLKTMMSLACTRDEVPVVSDQWGSPSSALDLADALLAIVRARAAGSSIGRGEAYHLSAGGEASWADFAEAIFVACQEFGAPSATVRRISTADWPTRATRPKRSVLDSSKFAKDFGVSLPAWEVSTRAIVARLASGLVQCG